MVPGPTGAVAIEFWSQAQIASAASTATMTTTTRMPLRLPMRQSCSMLES